MTNNFGNSSSFSNWDGLQIVDPFNPETVQLTLNSKICCFSVTFPATIIFPKLTGDDYNRVIHVPTNIKMNPKYKKQYQIRVISAPSNKFFVFDQVYPPDREIILCLLAPCVNEDLELNPSDVLCYLIIEKNNYGYESETYSMNWDEFKPPTVLASQGPFENNLIALFEPMTIKPDEVAEVATGQTIPSNITMLATYKTPTPVYPTATYSLHETINSEMIRGSYKMYYDTVGEEIIYKVMCIGPNKDKPLDYNMMVFKKQWALPILPSEFAVTDVDAGYEPEQNGLYALNLVSGKEAITWGSWSGHSVLKRITLSLKRTNSDYVYHFTLAKEFTLLSGSSTLLLQTTVLNTNHLTNIELVFLWEKPAQGIIIPPKTPIVVVFKSNVVSARLEETIQFNNKILNVVPDGDGFKISAKSDILALKLDEPFHIENALFTSKFINPAMCLKGSPSGDQFYLNNNVAVLPTMWCGHSLNCIISIIPVDHAPIVIPANTELLTVYPMHKY